MYNTVFLTFQFKSLVKVLKIKKLQIIFIIKLNFFLLKKIDARICNQKDKKSVQMSMKVFFLRTTCN